MIFPLMGVKGRVQGSKIKFCTRIGFLPLVLHGCTLAFISC